MLTLPAELYTFGSPMLYSLPTVLLVVIFINYIILPIFYNNQIDNCYAVIIHFLRFTYLWPTGRRVVEMGYKK